MTPLEDLLVVAVHRVKGDGLPPPDTTLLIGHPDRGLVGARDGSPGDAKGPFQGDTDGGDPGVGDLHGAPPDPVSAPSCTPAFAIRSAVPLKARPSLTMVSRVSKCCCMSSLAFSFRPWTRQS